MHLQVPEQKKMEPYEWSDEVPEDDPEFQVLLEEEKEAVVPGH